MAKRPVHWYEGMFLKPHHFQAADRFARERVKESEDWFHPHDWGLRAVSFDQDAIANYSVVLRSCQARFKDGTTVVVPDEAAVGPVELRGALSNATETTVFLAVPTWQVGRANVEAVPSAGGPRFVIDAAECADENTGADEEPIEFRAVQARLLLSNLDTTGYETLPIARIVRSAAADAPPRIDGDYVPPILGLDAWLPLQQQVHALHQQIGVWIDQEASMLVGRRVAFDNQVLGDAERILRLSALNAAYAAFQAAIFTRGLHPFPMYRELCRLLGQLAIFGPTRRPPGVPGYDHDDIGPIYARVIQEIRRLLPEPGHVAFEKRYFTLEGRNFQVHLEPEWTLDTSKLYLGVETTELSDEECEQLLQWVPGQAAGPALDWKLGSGEQVETIFQRGEAGLRMTALKRIPPALPAGVVYFEVERRPEYWKDVVRTHTLGLRFKLERMRFLSNRMVALASPITGRTYNLQFAVFVVKPA